MIKDFYYLLGVRRTASLSQIKIAYHKRAAEYHPDKVADQGPEAQERANEKMLELNEAMRILSDEALRREYDEIIELLPERIPEEVKPKEPPPPPPAEESPAAPEPQPEAAPAPEAKPKRPVVSEEAKEQRGLLMEEQIRNFREALKKLPLRWSSASMRGWLWAVKSGGLRRSVLVAYRHQDNLSLLSVRSLRAEVEKLLKCQQRTLGTANVIALVSYDRLMDAQTVQQQIQETVTAAAARLRNVHPVVTLLDRQANRAAFYGVTGGDADVQRVLQLLRNLGGSEG